MTNKDNKISKKQENSNDQDLVNIIFNGLSNKESKKVATLYFENPSEKTVETAREILSSNDEKQKSLNNMKIKRNKRFSQEVLRDL